jgi:hypothetical protein
MSITHGVVIEVVLRSARTPMDGPSPILGSNDPLISTLRHRLRVLRDTQRAGSKAQRTVHG